jgi:hypothetical protein
MPRRSKSQKDDESHIDYDMLTKDVVTHHFREWNTS